MNPAEPLDPLPETAVAPAPALDRARVLEEHEALLDAVEEKLGYRFHDRLLLLEALTHPSLHDTLPFSYERLEFLGDAVLGVIVAAQLFRRYPERNEGELTRIKSSVVSRSSLANLGRRLGVTEHILLGKGMKALESLPRSITANCTEALIGALYLDGGAAAARRFVSEQLTQRMEKAGRLGRPLNHKSILQHLTQRHGQGTPTYRVLSVSGPDHERTFVVCVVLGNREFAASAGGSKKLAEQRAARLALRELEAELDDAGAAPP